MFRKRKADKIVNLIGWTNTEINKTIFGAQTNETIRFVWIWIRMIINDRHWSLMFYVAPFFMLINQNCAYANRLREGAIFQFNASALPLVMGAGRQKWKQHAKTHEQFRMYRSNQSNCYYACGQWNCEKKNQLRPQIISIYLAVRLQTAICHIIIIFSSDFTHNTRGNLNEKK